ncbi:PREDICTED: MLO-like protein 3 [Nelumbo nucifera]|uniref:MLO-like protein n=2 Tax=Nelumbo nucifera TaxID=4432 RepID=A0A1U8ABA4_NELNU|nr:PREDICTED: MLO-like protein 3 [Nelumbo nucifera]DAD27951.1 TPA_asm: hypothetical protein HUJ06_029419 [Nelumbo nucifera]
MAVGAAGGVSSTTRSLQETPTWALAAVCFGFISLSIFLEHSIHLLTNWLKRRQKKALNEAVEKLKSELMLLGFMSLLLTVIQRPISSICIPTRVAGTMLPCHKSKTTKVTVSKHGVVYERLNGGRRSWSPFNNGSGGWWQFKRRLAEDSSDTSDRCASKGMVSLISQDGLHQIHKFIFVLAVMQLVYSLLTMALGRAKMKRWKAWEKEIQTVDYQVANDPRRFRYIRETTFGRRHMKSFTRTPVQLWIKCFFRQFFNSVPKVDYLTLRHGFISAHFSTNNNFNFQKYIKRSLEDDFKVVVRVSHFMWFLVIIFMLVDVHGWNVYLWVSFIPLFIVLVLGTKLEVIVTRMALQLKDQNIVIKGAPMVQPNDNFFWFSNPRFVLTLLHFTLFMNAFEFSFFIWVTIEYGLNSCYHEHIEITITRVVLAVTVQVLCSYITLPLYALVTQMGSQFKSAVLEEQTTKYIKQWHSGVREKMKRNRDQSSHSTGTGSCHSKTESTTIDAVLINQVSSSLSPRPTPTFTKAILFPGRDEIIQEPEAEKPRSPANPNRTGMAVVLELSEMKSNLQQDLQSPIT